MRNCTVFFKQSLFGALLVCSTLVNADNKLPDFNQYKDVKQKKRAFFDYLTPHVINANHEILSERNLIKSLDFTKLSNSEVLKVQALMQKYRLADQSMTQTAQQALLKKIDIIPLSLALAQAANESAWGTSRFAKQAYNFYGQWCFSKGCGLVPAKRSSGMQHEVRKFKSPYESVKGYMLNLNSHSAFKLVREARFEQRQQGENPSGIQLAKGLLNYSERKQAYIKEIRAMIRYNKLNQLDM